MGKTFKDQRKWERKQKEREDERRQAAPPKRKQKFHEEILPEDELDPYEYLDYEFDDR